MEYDWGMGFVIYYAKNRNNGKGYVGYTERGLEKRWDEHLKSAKKGGEQLLGNALRKHGGGSAFELSIVEECIDVPMMKLREMHWIRELRTHVSEWGYNLTFGGDGVAGWSPNEEHRRILSERHTGEKNHNFGKVWGKLEWTEEERLKLSEQRTGEGNPMYGRHHRDDARRKIGEAQYVPVVQYDMSGNLIAEFSSILEAMEKTGVGKTGISRAIRFPHRSAGGYRWSYLNAGISGREKLGVISAG